MINTPAFSAPKKMIPAESDNFVPNIFIYTLPDDIEQTAEPDDEYEYINEKISGSEKEPEDNNVYASTLKGYTRFVEDSNTIYLKDDSNNFVLNIKQPQKISGSKNLNIESQETKRILQYTNPEYAIAPSSIKSVGNVGDFTFGAMYSNEIDNIAMLETETGLFTKYEKERFALNSSVKKSLNTTYAQDYNTFTIAPELKLNRYMSIKNVLSADVTRNRRSSALIFSLNPFARKDLDRMHLEVGAKQTYYADSNTNKTEFSFSTVFKL